MATGPGLFSGGPGSPVQFDFRSRQQMLRDRLQANHDAMIKQITEMSRDVQSPAQKALINAGGMLGEYFRNKFWPEKLSPDEAAAASAQEDAKAAIQNWRADNPNASMAEYNDKSQELLANAYLKVGMPQGFAVLQSLQQQREASARAAAEERKLNADTRNTDQNTELQAEQVKDLTQKRVLGTIQDVWDVSKPYNQETPPMSLRIIDSGPRIGYAQGVDKDGNPVLLAPGQYAKTQPLRDPTNNLANRFTGAEARLLRDSLGYAHKEMNTALDLKNIVQSGVTPQGTVNFMGEGGKAADWVTRAVDTVSALVRAAGGSNAASEQAGGLNLDKEAAARQYVRNNNLVTTLNDIIPPDFRKNSNDAEKYLATLSQLVYASTYANEPNTRQVSHETFEQRMRQMGGLATSPQALQGILAQTINRDVVEIYSRYNMVPKDVRAQVLEPDSEKEWLDTFNKFKSAYLPPDWGTAAQVGPGLQGTPANTPQPKTETDDEFLNRTFGNQPQGQ